jgi:hypothetical protein
VRKWQQVATGANSSNLRATRFVPVQLESCPAMPVVACALTVGSLGDIQGLIALLCKLGVALYDANDASSDYQALKKEICAFYETLLEVEKVKDSISSESSVDSLASAIAQCRADLQDFETKYHMQNKQNKIKWAFWGNSTATSLRETLLAHRQTIQMRLLTFVPLGIRSIDYTKEIISAQCFIMVNPSRTLVTGQSRICTQSYNKEWRQCGL